jgi:hypothetical protein
VLRIEAAKSLHPFGEADDDWFRERQAGTHEAGG